MTRYARRETGVYVEVEVDEYDLTSAGYHHKDKCGQVHAEADRLDAALDDLHRQAGHGDFPVRVCSREPCRSLFLAHQGLVA